MAGMSVFHSSLSTELKRVVLSVLVSLSLLVLVIFASRFMIVAKYLLNLYGMLDICEI